MSQTTSENGAAVRDASVAILRQLGETLGLVDDAQYTTEGPSGATIGGHIRHTLDHYRKLADGYRGSETVAYDRRDRGGSVETDRSAAIGEAGALAEVFAGLDPTQMSFPVRVRAMVSGDGLEAEMESTVVRELWFASHHAIHHAALLKPIFSAVGVALPEAFGRAPSTVNFETAGG
jgi:hypothetical protein